MAIPGSAPKNAMSPSLAFVTFFEGRQENIEHDHIYSKNANMESAELSWAVFRVAVRCQLDRDMVSRAQAKDLALAPAAILNAQQDSGISPRKASPRRSNGRQALLEPKAA